MTKSSNNDSGSNSSSASSLSSSQQSSNTLSTPFGNFQLDRQPVQKRQLLRAWDAADELLLNYLFKQQSQEGLSQHYGYGEIVLGVDNYNILLVNDNFGALTCALSSAFPTTSGQINIGNWSDSAIAHSAAKINILHNKLNSRINYIKSTDTPPQHYHLVILKIPKTTALLEYQLIELRKNISEHTTVIAAGMSKYIQKSHLKLFEKYIGETHTSLAQKKARLIFSKPANVIVSTKVSSPYPTFYSEQNLNLSLSNHANVFSREKLDIGARFLLDQFQKLPEARTIVDLGCGNGVLGICAKRIQRELYGIDSQVIFVDESYMAIDSTKTNYDLAFDDHRETRAHASYFTNNSLQGIDLPEIDLVLCNPPFHQQHAMSDSIAWLMLEHSRSALRPGGSLWLIGNRHLAYDQKIKRVFSNVRQVASNNKFTVYSAKR